jgi:protein OS-9
MRSRLLSRHIVALSFAFQVAAARLLHSLPEDTYAFPKYRVSFLNGLPVLRETAERWLQQGLRGGESEFLDQPWSEGNLQDPKGIGNGEASEVCRSVDYSCVLSIDYVQAEYSKTLNATLEHMKMGPGDSYICLIPPSPDSPAPPSEERQEDVTPVQSWALLKPLSGRCLYVCLHPTAASGR